MRLANWTRVVSFLMLLTLPMLPLSAAHITDKLLAGLYPSPSTEGQPLRVLPSGTPLDVIEKSEIFTKVRLGDNSEGWIENQFITDEKPARVMLLELQVKNNQLQQQVRKLEKQSATQGSGTDSSKDHTDAEIEELKLQLADARGELAALKSAPKNSPSLESGLEANQLEIAKLKDALNKAEQQLKSPENSALEIENSELKKRISVAAAALGINPKGSPPPVESIITEGYKPWHFALAAFALLISFAGGVAYKNHRLAQRYGGFRV